MTQEQFLRKCEECKCQTIYKGVTAHIDEGVKYWIYGIRNCYIVCALPVSRYGQFPLFDELNYRQHYMRKELMNGKQLSLRDFLEVHG